MKYEAQSSLHPTLCSGTAFEFVVDCLCRPHARNRPCRRFFSREYLQSVQQPNR